MTAKAGMAMLKEKARAAQDLANKHYRIEEGLRQIFRLNATEASESTPTEPIKLLEINDGTVATGIRPLQFGASPENGVPFASVIVEVTPDEFARIKSRELKLPRGWKLGEELPRPVDEAASASMANAAAWRLGYARQANADLSMYQTLERDPSTEICHRLQFLQMACEKLVKTFLCSAGENPASLLSGHAYVKAHLPTVLRQEAVFRNFTGPRAREVLRRSRHLAEEIDVLAPAVKRGGRRPDNCEYPWEDDTEKLHVPLDWSFQPARLVIMPSGRTILKLIQSAIDRLVP